MSLDIEKQRLIAEFVLFKEGLRQTSDGASEESTPTAADAKPAPSAQAASQVAKPPALDLTKLGGVTRDAAPAARATARKEPEAASPAPQVRRRLRLAASGIAAVFATGVAAYVALSPSAVPGDPAPVAAVPPAAAPLDETADGAAESIREAAAPEAAAPVASPLAAPEAAPPAAQQPPAPPPAETAAVAPQPAASAPASAAPLPVAASPAAAKPAEPKAAAAKPAAARTEARTRQASPAKPAPAPKPVARRAAPRPAAPPAEASLAAALPEPPAPEAAPAPPPPPANGPLGIGYVQRAAGSVGGAIKDIGQSARGYLPF
jgi:hypothetical protein